MSPTKAQIHDFICRYTFLHVLAIGAAFPIPVSRIRSFAVDPLYSIWYRNLNLRNQSPIELPVLLLFQRDVTRDYPVPQIYWLPDEKGMISTKISQQFMETNAIKNRLFYNSLGDFIEASGFFPIEINVPDMLSSMWGFMMSLPFFNRWQQQQQQQQEQQTKFQMSLKRPLITELTSNEPSYEPIQLYP